MKKKIVVLMLCTMMAVTALGCGGKKNNAAEGTEIAESVNGTETTEAEAEAAVEYESPAYDLKASDYVTLCDYSKVPVTITGDYDVDDQDAKDYFEQMFSYYGPFYVADDTKTTVGEGDIVNVDYVGKLDGEAFDNGSAEDQNIDVDNNCSAGSQSSSFIDGFTDDLKGASVGDVIDSDVTFPDNYGNADLAGKQVVFTFTVNSIQKEMTLDDVDDEFAQKQFQADTVDDMYAQIKTFLENTASSNKDSDTYAAVQQYLLDNCKVDIPEDYLTARVNDYEKQFVQNNCDGDDSKLEDYVSKQYNMTLDEVRQEWRSGMEKNISMEFITGAIAEKEGTELDEDGFSSYVQTLMSSNNFSSEEDLYKNYGYGDAAYGEKYLRQIYVDNLALQSVKDNAEVTVEAPAETESTESAEPQEAVDATETEAAN
jgi:trigger factor